MLETVRQWWEHEKYAMGKVLESFGSVPPERRGDADFQRALDKFAHLLAARDVWLSRIADHQRPDEVFPKDATIGAIGAALGRTHSAWDRYMNALDEQTLASAVEYRSTEGSEWSNSVLQILTHAYTHGFYHRGQIATLLSDLGGSAADTDFIFFARRQNAHRAAV